MRCHLQAAFLRAERKPLNYYCLVAIPQDELCQEYYPKLLAYFCLHLCNELKQGRSREIVYIWLFPKKCG